MRTVALLALFATAHQAGVPEPTSEAPVFPLHEQQRRGGPEYALERTARGVEAHNAAHRFDARFTSGNVAITVDGATARMTFDGHCRGSRCAAAPQLVETVVEGAEIQYRRGEIDEWYLNGPLGLEQGLVVREATAGTGAVGLRFDVHGDATPLRSGSSVRLATHDGRTLAYYGGLDVRDSNGRVLRSWLDVHGSQILIRFDDTGARYPVHVDPFVWTEETLTPPTTLDPVNSQFGRAVAADGDLIVVGDPACPELLARNECAGVGAAYAYERVDGTWGDPQPLVVPGSPEHAYGVSVAVSATTGQILVGAPGSYDEVGAVHIFDRVGVESWSYAGRLAPSADVGIAFRFGNAVAMTPSGDGAIVGAPYTHGPVASHQGAAHFYRRESTAWVYDRRLDSPSPCLNCYFGDSVDVDGGYVAVGEPARDSGMAYVFDVSGEVTTTLPVPRPTEVARTTERLRFGDAVSLRGTTLAVGAEQFQPSLASGRAWIYDVADLESGGELLAADPPVSGERFGTAVAVRDGLAVVGAPGDRTYMTGPVSQGRVLTFLWDGSTWLPEALPPTTDFPDGGHAGYAVAYTGAVAVIGGYGNGGRAYAFRRQGGLGEECSGSGRSECLSGHCAPAGICCAVACDGACERCTADGSSCEPLPARSVEAACLPYVCNGSAGVCADSCGSDADCSTGNFCDGTECVPLRLDAGTDAGTDAQVTSDGDIPSDGGPASQSRIPTGCGVATRPANGSGWPLALLIGVLFVARRRQTLDGFRHVR